MRTVTTTENYPYEWNLKLGAYPACLDYPPKTKKKKKDPLIRLSGKADRGIFERSPNATFVSLISKKSGAVFLQYMWERRGLGEK